MKSIYEASVAYGREHQGSVNIEDFEAGANYVLGEIEKLVKFNRWAAQDLYELISGHTLMI